MKRFPLLRRFKPYLTPFKLPLFLGFLCGLLGGSASVITTFYLGKSMDLLIAKNLVNFSALGKIMVLLGIVMFTTVITQYLTQFFANKIAYESVNLLRKDALNHLDSLPLHFFDNHPQGDLISRFTNDMDNISIAVTAIFAQLFQGVTTIVLALIFMLYLSPLLTLIVLATTPLTFLVNFLVAKHSRKTFVAQQEILGELSSYAKEGITESKIVLAFQEEDHRQSEFEKKNQELYEKGQKAQFASSLTNPMARLVDHLAYVFIAFGAGYLYLYHPGLVTIGILSSFTIYAGQFSKPFIELSGLMTQLQMAQVGLKRSLEILDEVPIKEDLPLTPITNLKGDISFQHVFFSYNKQQPLIEDFNLHVLPGEKVAIVGKTGAGKSTLVNLLMRFYEVNQGTITLDGKNIQEYHRDSYRQVFGMVLQDTWLFDSTIRENLKFGSTNVSDEAMIVACKKAQIHHFIESLPDKYDTVLGQGGIEVSNGQRQLLTIARIILKNPPMLILDEATSSVDTLTEKLIQQGFNQMMQGKTSFIIAHRLSTIENADKILVMDHGQVIQQGKHQELLKIKGPYQELYQAQFQK